jgi:hypothetical protein
VSFYLSAVLCLKDYTKQANPIFPQDLDRLMSVCNFDFFGMRDRLSMHFLFDYALRAGSLVRCRSTDVNFFELHNGLNVQVTFSSHKGTRRNEQISTTFTAHGYWASLLERYFKQFKLHCQLENLNFISTPFFGFSTTSAFTERLYRLCYFAGYPRQFFSAHSFRAGKVAFDAAEKCHLTKDYSNFSSIVEANKFIGGWFGDKIKLYIRNYVTRFKDAQNPPSQYTVEELHAPLHIQINPPAMVNIHIGTINRTIALKTAEQWFWCFQQQIQHDFNADNIHDVFKISAQFFTNNCQIFRELCFEECNEHFTAQRLLTWLTLSSVIKPSLFIQQTPQQAMDLLNQAIANMPVLLRNVLKLLKRNEMEDQSDKYIPTMNLSNSRDSDAARANIANRRRRNINFHQ